MPKVSVLIVKGWQMLNSFLDPFFSPSSEKEKVEGEELQELLKLVVAPAELTYFVRGKQGSLLPLQTGPR